ncbi:MAG: phosphate signaling complex protein PhoU [Chromatiales bacterium]|nr:phosphate signaling complex protein PhoU [Chromatiales bacterium]
MSEITEGHIVRRFDGDLAKLHQKILEMGGLAADQVSRAVHAVIQGDREALAQVVSRDHLINESETGADAMVARLFAQRQPMGIDLRVVLAFSKVITELERAGDEAKRIAELGIQLYSPRAGANARALLCDVTNMGELASNLMRLSLEALDHLDAEAAANVILAHRRLDAEFQSCFRRLATYIMEDSRNVGDSVNVLLVTKSLERIGDNANHMAAHTIYMVEGKDVRHLSVEEMDRKLAEGPATISSPGTR